MSTRRLLLVLIVLCLGLGCATSPAEPPTPTRSSKARTQGPGAPRPTPSPTSTGDTSRSPGPSASSQAAIPSASTGPSQVAAATSTVSTAPASPRSAASPGTSTAPASSGPAASATISTAPSAGTTGQPVTLAGTVYTETRAGVADASVTVRSLDATTPFERTVSTTAAGAWSVAATPSGINLEVTATKAGFTTRRQTFTALPGQGNTLDFGGAANPAGGGWFISDRPEIAATTPAQDATGVSPTDLAYTIDFSESLGAASKAAFERAFHLIPANRTAGETFTPASGLETPANAATNDGLPATWLPLGGATLYAYVISTGATFLESPLTAIAKRWENNDSRLTLTFAVPLRNGAATGAAYQAVLFSPGAADRVVDGNGNVLGTDSTGNPAWPASGPIYNVFKRAALAGTTGWADSHHTALGFQLARDATAPRLLGLTAAPDGVHLRLTFRFSEAMGAYAGPGLATVDPTVYRLANYTFALATSAANAGLINLTGRTASALADLDDNGVEVLAQRLAAATPFSFSARTALGEWDGVEFTAGTGAGRAPEESQGGGLAVRVSPGDPRNVEMWILNGRNVFDGYTHLKVRLEGVSDPAGNEISRAAASADQVTATL